MKRTFRVLVTAGDTYEAIDDVRKVTHMATGRLGCLIADEFVRNGARVTLICGELSMRPDLAMEHIVEIQGVESLQDAIIGQLSKTRFDCVIHSMAVSDYTVRGLATEDDIADEICKALLDSGTAIDEGQIKDKVKLAISNALHNTSGKISSELASLIVAMDSAPKVISHVKRIQPDTVLVGFKLLSGVPEQELIQAAQAQMHSCGSDFVLANDLSGIQGDKHAGILVGKDGILDRPATKQEIAESIVRYCQVKG